MTKLNAEIKKVAQSGYQFLKIDADARAAAMGGAFILVGTGASSMFYNPAGMTEQPVSIDFFSTQTNWLADIGYYSLGVTKKLGNFGVIGFSMQTSDYGSIIGTRVADNTAGFIETGNVEVDAVHPIDYTERVNIGIEYGFKKIFFLRGGYKFNHDTEGLSLGIGFSIRLIGLMTKLSYSFNDAGSFYPVNRISIGISL